MADDNRKIHISEEQVSAGRKHGVVRWILGVGLLLAVAFMTIIWVTGAATQSAEEGAVTASDNIRASEGGDGTDSIPGSGTNSPTTGGSADEGAQIRGGASVIENDPS